MSAVFVATKSMKSIALTRDRLDEHQLAILSFKI